MSNEKIWWIVQFEEGGKCGVVENGDIVEHDDDLNIGSFVKVVTAQNKLTGRKYPSTILKGPFNTKKGANSSLSLYAKPAEPIMLPRACPSCQQLNIQLNDQTSLSETLRNELREANAKCIALEEKCKELEPVINFNATQELLSQAMSKLDKARELLGKRSFSSSAPCSSSEVLCDLTNYQNTSLHDSHVPLHDSNPFCKVLVTPSAKSSILFRMSALESVKDDHEVPEKKKRAQRSAFLRALIRSFFDDAELERHTFSGRNSAVADKSKFIIMQSFCTKIVGLVVEDREWHEAYGRCRETLLFKSKPKAGEQTKKLVSQVEESDKDDEESEECDDDGEVASKKKKN